MATLIAQTFHLQHPTKQRRYVFALGDDAFGPYITMRNWRNRQLVECRRLELDEARRRWKWLKRLGYTEWE